MGSAHILVDLAAVVKASRNVASRHLELRTRQIDRYGRTSSIVRSLGGDRKPPQSAAANAPPGDGREQPAGENAPTVQSGAVHEELGLQGQQQSNVPENLPLSGMQSDGAMPSTTEQQQEAHPNLFRRSEPPEDATIQRPQSITPNQSAILAQLKEKVNEAGKQDDDRSSFLADAPPDANVNIFHTSRGSQMLEGQKDAVGQKRPKGAPSKPSWFKDFGHDKEKTQKEDTAPLPSVAETAARQGMSPLEESAIAAADVAVGSPLARNLDSSIAEAQETAGSPSPSIAKTIWGQGPTPVEKSALSVDTPETTMRENTPDTSAQQSTENKESESRQVVEEHTQMVNEVLSKAEQYVPKQSDPISAATTSEEPTKPAYSLRESKVPATRISRLWNYGGLAAGMLGGAITEGFSRGLGGGGQGSVMFSPGNMERLVTKLSRMRGAALKLGQMMSFQDSKMLPGPIQEVLQRVQDRADYMPAWQRDRVLTASLGPEWRDLYGEFEETPMAAASIGQVHRATLKSTGEQVAVKIQFPGVADSINSDLDNLSMLLTASKMLPKGLYLNKTIDNARTELGWECDYEREAECGRRYKELLADEPDVFTVPNIYSEASGRHVLTMEFMHGTGVTRAAPSLTQEQRDWIGTQILRLCLREIAEFRFMQTDPNWTNFLYHGATHKLELLDFGASREYPQEFVTQYVGLLEAAARADKPAVKDLSERLGYLTGHESRAMLDAHTASILTLAEPFLESAPAVYDFRDQTITERVKALIPVMIRERLSPPPEETYSLHRKLSGAFLLCARLGSRVRCREMFVRALEKMEDVGAK
ncbi:Uu.00g092680.m01.CDS01 [Anthostomella pinea]|uniref:Uu.00g092680.m01.CDS01 n=1 Tax=Anthostomella pinea TaxID=933095 RepID=A0AAI8VP02_9PEZI|nr:Uu.00g092680.m01.CDS01 [Anthostomella pinea]